MTNIAIKGHLTRGKGVIKILESLGGINSLNLSGHSPSLHYYISNNSTIRCSAYNSNYKIYTVEEFEKEFPFKSKVTKTLRTCKKMKEERNITLTLDKAKEWYEKGGELREVALQAYSEKELNKAELPKTWEEFCENYVVKDGEVLIEGYSRIVINSLGNRHPILDKNICPSQKSAEAHLALIQLEQLRDCYRGLSVTVIGMPVWCIIRQNGKLIICQRKWGRDETFLSFQSLEVAKEYFDNFEPLIKQAGDLI